MKNANIFDDYREMARLCLDCIYGNTARPEHKGLAYECVKKVVEADCPFWKIYQAESHACDASAPARVRVMNGDGFRAHAAETIASGAANRRCIRDPHRLSAK